MWIFYYWALVRSSVSSPLITLSALWRRDELDTVQCQSQLGARGVNMTCMRFLMKAMIWSEWWKTKNWSCQEMFRRRIFSPTWPFTRIEDTRAARHATLVAAESDLPGWQLSVCSCSALSSSLVSLSSTLPLSRRVRNVNCVRNEIAETWMCSHHPTHLSTSHSLV